MDSAHSMGGLVARKAMELERRGEWRRNEASICRRESANGTCLESVYVFSLAEQYHPVIDSYPQLVNIEVEAGHVEIVGYKEVAPRKLLAILQKQGLLAPTPPERRTALEQLLTELY